MRRPKRIRTARDHHMKKNLAVIGATLVSSVFVPLAVFAQTTVTQCGSPNPGIEKVICTVYRLIQIVIPVMILGAVAYFIWGIVQFITAHDAEEKGEARGAMVHGIIGFAVILGLWGLVKILLSTFGLGNDAGAGVIPVF